MCLGIGVWLAQQHSCLQPVCADGAAKEFVQTVLGKSLRLTAKPGTQKGLRVADISQIDSLPPKVGFPRPCPPPLRVGAYPPPRGPEKEPLVLALFGVCLLAPPPPAPEKAASSRQKPGPVQPAHGAQPSEPAGADRRGLSHVDGPAPTPIAGILSGHQRL